MLHAPVESSLSADALRARDAYLALINPSHKSHVTNLFLEAARAGLFKPTDVLARVLGEVRRRLDAATDDGERSKWAAILTTLARPEALAFAGYAIHYAALPEVARRRMKATRQATFIDGYMERQDPTPSQLTLLRRMGWEGTPSVANRAEAAALLGALLAGREVSHE